LDPLLGKWPYVVYRGAIDSSDVRAWLGLKALA